MSSETAITLNTDTLIGFTDQRGMAWHYRAELQGEESNHYPGAIPIEDVRRRLFPWEAVKAELTARAIVIKRNDDTGDYEEELIVNVNDHAAILRSDTGAVLGIHGAESYKIHQFSDWLLDEVGILIDDDLQVGSAGVLRGGAQAWVQIEMPETMQGPGGIEFRPFLLMATSHDGKLASTYKVCAQLVVCDNTLAIGLSEATRRRISVKHTKNSELPVNDAREALGIVFDSGAAFSEELDKLLNETVSDTEWGKIVAALAPIPEEEGRGKTVAENKNGALANLWRNDPRVAPWTGTMFGALQAANTYRHHIATVRGAGTDQDAVRILRGQRNMEAALTGKGQQADIDMLKLARAAIAA